MHDDIMETDRVLTEEEQWRQLVETFYLAATFQGRAAYFLMSFHAANPIIFNSLFGFDPYPYFWATMVYGLAVMIFSRPSMTVISTVNRLAFAILGSLMFNHSSMICYQWFCTVFPDSPYMRVFFAFLSGRIMMVHLLAFLYHVDTRSNIPGLIVPRDYSFEGMYI